MFCGNAGATPESSKEVVEQGDLVVDVLRDTLLSFFVNLVEHAQEPRTGSAQNLLGERFLCRSLWRCRAAALQEPHQVVKADVVAIPDLQQNFEGRLKVATLPRGDLRRADADEAGEFGLVASTRQTVQLGEERSDVSGHFRSRKHLLTFSGSDIRIGPVMPNTTRRARRLARIRRAMRANGITQAMVVRKLGLTRSHVSHVLKGDEISERVLVTAEEFIAKASSPGSLHRDAADDAIFAAAKAGEEHARGDAA